MTRGLRDWLTEVLSSFLERASVYVCGCVCVCWGKKEGVADSTMKYSLLRTLG